MLLLLWLLNVVFSLIVRAIGPLVTPIARDLQLSYTQMGFILGSWPGLSLPFHSPLGFPHSCSSLVSFRLIGGRRSWARVPSLL